MKEDHLSNLKKATVFFAESKPTKHIKKLAAEIYEKDKYSEIKHIEQWLCDIKDAMLKGRYYTRVEKVSASGMSRTISIAYIKDNVLHHVQHPGILALAGCNRDGRIPGCGMDMLFAAQYNLFYALHGSHKCNYQDRMARYNYL